MRPQAGAAALRARPALTVAIRRAALVAAAALACLGYGWAQAQTPSAVAPEFAPAEIRRVLAHGPWPPPAAPDPGNRLSRDPIAAALGRALFFDARLSGDGAVSCATCHRPELDWTDGRTRAEGRVRLDRNTPSLWNVAGHAWFGWDGASDSLWAHSLKPILDGREMAGSAARTAGLLRADPVLACLLAKLPRPAAPAADPGTAALVDVAKALAAFQETLVTPRTPFDAFRDALAAGDAAAASLYPADARRGLAMFVGRGNCSVCHFGPAFTNRDFADIGVPFMAAPGRPDPGRHGGIARVLRDPFNRLGAHSDDPAPPADRVSARATRHVEAQHRNWGEFKVPGLRNVARTAPYMHAGSHATLADVVRHYSELDEDRIHSDGERVLRPLRLSGGERDDLVAFLQSLTSPPAPLPAKPEALAACGG